MVESSHKFDVFLAHNTVDKPQVRAIARELRKRGLNPWLDEEQIPPGRSFQEQIQQAIPQVKSAAIFIGLEGLGRWQILEIESFISRCVDENIPVIPVLLPEVDKIPDNLHFLRRLHRVSFEKIDDAALDKLEWGITGVKPNLEPIILSTSVSPSTSETLHQLYIIEQRKGDQIIYRYEFKSSTLQLLQSFESKPITSKRLNYVQNYYEVLESKWLGNQNDVEEFTVELRAFGGKLFDDLFPYELQSILWQYRSEIQSIMVFSTEPFIPWELVLWQLYIAG